MHVNLNLYSISYFLLIIAFIYSMYAQSKIATVYSKYFSVPSKKGMTGMQVARDMLDRHGFYDVKINSIPGTLTDHYDPRTKEMNLSEGVYYGSSIASIGVAAHETGHAIQHGENYALMRFRSVIAPIAVVSSQIVWILIFAGFIMSQARLIRIAAIMFLCIFIFQMVTLPVEYDASRRALANLEGMGYIAPDEYTPIRKILKAAISTYIAATIGSFAQLLRILSFSRRD